MLTAADFVTRDASCVVCRRPGATYLVRGGVAYLRCPWDDCAANAHVGHALGVGEFVRLACETQDRREREGIAAARPPEGGAR